MLDITSLLDSAQSPDAATRNAAEGQLKGLQESQFPSFVLSLAAELGSGDKPVSSRRLAGLVLKNALDAKEASRQVRLDAGRDPAAGPGWHCAWQPDQITQAPHHAYMSTGRPVGAVDVSGCGSAVSDQAVAAGHHAR